MAATITKMFLQKERCFIVISLLWLLFCYYFRFCTLWGKALTQKHKESADPVPYSPTGPRRPQIRYGGVCAVVRSSNADLVLLVKSR